MSLSVLSGLAGPPGTTPVEVSNVIHSTDRGLRLTVRSLLELCAKKTDPSPGSILIRSVTGGGASEVARYLALVACQTRGARLLSLRGLAPGAPGRDVFLGNLRDWRAQGRIDPGALYIIFSDCPDDVGSRWEGPCLRIPPISARPEDAVNAARLLGRQFLPPGVNIAPDALELARDYFWPGDIAHMRVTLSLASQRCFVENTRVLDAAMIRAVLGLKERNLAELCRLDKSGWTIPLGARDLLQLANFTGFMRVRKALEQLLIEGAVDTGDGNAAVAAKYLRIPYTTMISRQKVLNQFIR